MTVTDEQSGAQATARAIEAMADAIEQHHDELTDLDRAIGDGDHGENLQRGFAGVRARLAEEQPETPAGVLRLVATALISSVGGASGPLFGTAFLRASVSLGDDPVVDAAGFAAALRAAQDGVVARGKAQPGDKTMLDALEPAVRAAESAAASGDLGATVQQAAEAADEGARASAPLQARKGRASYLGERSVDHVDPGARSVALLLGALHESCQR